MRAFRVTLANGRSFKVTVPEAGETITEETTPGALELFSEAAIGQTARFADLASRFHRPSAASFSVLGLDQPAIPDDAVLQAASAAGLTDPAALRREDIASVMGRQAPFAVGGAVARPAAAATELLSALGGGAGEVVGRELGGETGAVLGGIGGAITPAGLTAASRRAFGTRAGAEEAIALRQATGAPLGLPEVGGSGLARLIERTMTKVPGGAQVARNRATRIALQVQTRLDNAARRLAGRRLTTESGGRALAEGFDDFTRRFQSKSGDLYDSLRSAIGDTQARPAKYAQALADLMRSEVGDATATSGQFGAEAANLVKGAAKAFKADLDRTGGVMTGSQLDQIRRGIGRELGDANVIGTQREGVLKKLYAAITEDMRLAAYQADRGARAAGGQATALRQFERATNHWRAGLARRNQIHKEIIGREIPSKILQALETSARSGPETVRALRRSLKPDQWNAAMGVVLKRLGEDVKGEVRFSTLLSNIGRMQKSGGFRELFKQGPLATRGVGEDLIQLAKVAEGSQSLLKELANPSGTSMSNVLSLATTGGVGAFFTGFMPEYLAIIGGTIGGSAAVNAALASPQLLHWVAMSTKLPVNQLPAHIDRLGKLAESDERAAELLEGIRGSLQ